MKENQDRNPQNVPEEESNAARIIRALGGDEEKVLDEPLKINKWENFWYHHKTKVIMIAAFTFMIGVAVVQCSSQTNPDVNLIYSGPDYITANMNRDFCDMLETFMPDYNEDGKKYAQLNDMVFKTQNQIEEFESEMAENGNEGAIDRLANSQMSERFTYEIFGSEASICLLAWDQYEMVASSGGFIRLDEMFDEIPEGAVDEYGILFSETKLYKFYDSAKIFPEDTVLAIRKLSTMSAITGVKKAEQLHENNRDMFIRMINFEYPEGYVPPEETKNAESEQN